ncbi:hypothetical protein [Microbacterium sp. NPDC089695]|uniref:hypothetical protein n=1 Tax=Microbacterium sp. NPDC089695 TaxID=3364198 RepID=UPI003820DDE5
MTEDLEPTAPPLVPAGMTEEEKHEIIAKRLGQVSDTLSMIPLEAASSREFGFLFAVHIDEHGNMDPPKGQVDLQTFKSVLDLELRIVAIEKALRKAGLLPE